MAISVRSGNHPQFETIRPRGVWSRMSAVFAALLAGRPQGSTVDSGLTDGSASAPMTKTEDPVYVDHWFARNPTLHLERLWS